MLRSGSAGRQARRRQVAVAPEAADTTLWRFSMQDGLTDLADRRALDLDLAEQLALAARHHAPWRWC